MSQAESSGKKPSRRGFLSAAGSLAAVAGTGVGLTPRAEATPAITAAGTSLHSGIEPFWGLHQSGIVTPQQRHSYFLAFDLTTHKRDDITSMLQAWTIAAARMTQGQTAAALTSDQETFGADSGEALDLPPSHLTLTFGFGPGLFTKDGKDRYGLAAHRPEALVDLPRFNGDQLAPTHTGGDISIQACANDPQVAFHAARQLARLAYDTAEIHWAQSGFMPDFGAKTTPRNLMGFKDGTNNPQYTNAKAMSQVVWVDDEGPTWMRGGSYLVARRIRIALEHWDRTNVGFQEQTVGRHKYSGAPLGKKNEFEPLSLDTTDKDGNPVNPESSHVRLAAPESNGGAQILRRPYSYNDGVNFTAERWPPWRQGMEYDAGLFFMSYQRDPRTGFIKIFEKMAKLDMMNQFATHVGGGLFACPGGIEEGKFIGQKLFEKASA